MYSKTKKLYNGRETIKYLKHKVNSLKDVVNSLSSKHVSTIHAMNYFGNIQRQL